MRETSRLVGGAVNISSGTLLHGFGYRTFSGLERPLLPTAHKWAAVSHIHGSILRAQHCNFNFKTTLVWNVISFHNQCLIEKISAMRIKAAE
jgi:hypothetical protein